MTVPAPTCLQDRALLTYIAALDAEFRRTGRAGSFILRFNFPGSHGCGPQMCRTATIEGASQEFCLAHDLNSLTLT